MPHISHRGTNMPPSPIRKLVPYAEAAKKRGIEVFHLNIGQPDIKTPQVALDAVKHNNIDVLAYSRSEGSEEYRTKLADYYRKNKIDVNPNEIIITTGGSEALFFTIGAIADAGDEIIIPEPFYANYNSFTIANNVSVVPVTCSIEDGFALPKISDFEALITPKTKAILICNPGNPTGYVYTRAEIEELKALVLKHDLFLIADEVYREFVYDGLDFHSVMSEYGLEQNAIMIDSVSKRYSMCGARIGCVVSRNVGFMATILKYAQSRLSPPTYAQIASEAALETPQSYFEEVIVEYVGRRDTLMAELNKIEGIKVSAPKGAFYCIAELPVEDADHFAQWLLERFENNNQTVMVAPASGFYADPVKGKKQVRIAYVLKKEDLIRSVELLKLALEEYNK